MPRKTYVNRQSFEVLNDVDDHRDINFPNSEWSRSPSGLSDLQTRQVPVRYWIFDPAGGDALREMTAAEKTVVDTDPTRLAAARQARKAELRQAVDQFMATRYSARVRATLLELSHGASGAVTGALNAYFAWQRRVWAAYRAASNAIDAAGTIVDVQAVTIAFGPIAAQDPGLTLDQASS